MEYVVVRIVRFLIFFVLIVILSFVFDSPSSATVFFDDNFSLGTLDKWEDFGGGVPASSWKVENASLVGEVGRYESSILRAKIGSTLGDFVFEANAINVNGVDQVARFRVSDDGSKYYQIGYRYNEPDWPQDSNNITLRKRVGRSECLVGLYPSASFPRTYDLSQNVQHKLKVVFNNYNIKVYFDGQLAIDYNDLYGQCGWFWTSGDFMLVNWGGDFYSGTVKNYFDDIRFLSLDHIDPIITSTPSPTPTPPHKIIILPGLGASWNERAMVLNEIVADNDWKMTPFVSSYDGLVKALEDKGKQRDRDFYVWNYDWRRPVSEIESELGSFVDTKVGSNEKVDFVGHSLGGLTARMWGQDHGGDPRLGKVVTLGSPHLGVINAYEAWNGGKISDKFDVASVAFNILLQLQKKNNQSDMAVIRAYAPVIADILPTFDFAKKNGTVLGWTTLATPNNYLNNKNSNISSLFGNFRAMVGTGLETKEWLDLNERSVFDATLGLWPDGKPVKLYFSAGDGTVLRKSARFEADEFSETESSHADLPDKFIGSIFDELGLGSTVASLVPSMDWSKSIVFYLGSPAVMKVNCDGSGEVVDNNGFLVIKDNNFNSCLLNLTGIANGTYHLVTGRTDKEDSWKYFEGEISNEENVKLVFAAKTGELSLDSGNSDYLYNLVKRDLALLKVGSLVNNKYLVGGLNAVVGKNLGLLSDNVFAFRKEQKETRVTNRIINNLTMLWMINYKTVSIGGAKTLYNKAVGDKSLVDRTTRLYERVKRYPTMFGSVNYNLLDGLLNRTSVAVSLNSWSEVAGRAVIVSRLTKLVW